MIKERFAHYMVGIEVIDNDHWQILLQFDEITAVIKENDIEKGKILLFSIKDSLNTHYHEEERFMHLVNYPYIKAHAAEHVRLKIKMENIIERLGALTGLPYSVSTDWLISDLTNLLIGHIDAHDMQYASYVKNLKK